MNKQLQQILLIGSLALVMLNFYACQEAEGNQTGSEYMPDMAHSVAYEANYYSAYSLNTWDEASVISRAQLSRPRQPVLGTVPRGYAGVFLTNPQSKNEVLAALRGMKTADSLAVPINGNVPYYYPDTEEGRAQATAEILYNPFPITANGLARGEELYNVFCAICHGTKGNFNDGIYEKGTYPLAPANLINDEFVNASNGRFYHAIMYGKNAMGPYKDKISFEERWQVIHYIRALQAQEKGLAYGEEENTLNGYAVTGMEAGNYIGVTPTEVLPNAADAEKGMEGEEVEPRPGETQPDPESHNDETQDLDSDHR